MRLEPRGISSAEAMRIFDNARHKSDEKIDLIKAFTELRDSTEDAKLAILYQRTVAFLKEL